MSTPTSKLQRIVVELLHHLPFSMFGSMIALLAMGTIAYIVASLGGGSVAQAAHAGHDHGDGHLSPETSLFHLFHAMHVLTSAIATTAMFWKHDNHKVVKAAAIGLLGSISICGLSDIVFPFVGGLILGADMDIHICLIEDPLLVWPFAIIGVLAGFVVTRSFERSTEYSHSMHVFVSSVASLLYLMSFGMYDWTHAITGVFLVILSAVVFPCCLSDIVFPMACTHRYCSSEDDEGIHHH